MGYYGGEKGTEFSVHDKKKFLEEIHERSQENIESARRYSHASDIKSRIVR
jgi:hypothetical protein